MQTTAEHVPMTTDASATNGKMSVRESDDVSYLNVLVMRWYVLHVVARQWHDLTQTLQERRELLMAELWKGLPAEWPSSRVTREWMPLPIYTIVERNLARILGSPDRLFEAGFVGGFDSTFGAVAVKRIVLIFSFLLRFFMNVVLLYSTFTPRWIFNLYNQLKTVVCLEESWNRVVLQTTYRVADGESEPLREPIEDVLSSLYWAPGMIATGARFWGLRPRVRHHLIELDLIALLERLKEFMIESVSADGNFLMVGNTQVAVRAWLRQPDDSPYFIQPAMEPQGNLTRPGWLVTEDIVVHTPPTDLHPETIEWVVLKQGTYCCGAAGCSIAAYELDVPWWYVPSFRLLGFIGGIVKPLIEAILGDRVKATQEQTYAQQLYRAQQSADEHRERFSQGRFPNRKIRELAERGEVQRVLLEEPVGMIIDLAGSTRLAELSEDEEQHEQLMQRYRETVLEEILQYDHAIRGDDQVVVIFNDGTGDGFAFSFVGANARERLNTALCVAEKLHDRCGDVVGPDGQPLQVRIGIERLGNLWLSSTKRAPCIFTASGKALNRAARYQEAGKRKEQFGPVRITMLRAELAAEVDDRWIFEAPEETTIRLRREAEPVSLVRVIGPRTSDG